MSMPAATPREQGATAVTIGAMMLLLIGMAAIAIDVGAGFNERRQDQTASDVAVMAGAINSVNGISAVRDAALDLALRNLSYSSIEEQALWEACVDPPAERNSEAGDNFVALSPPSGWTPTDPSNWCISLDSAKGLLRVRVPDQTIDTNFASVLGADTLTTSAAAVAEIETLGGSGGVLPFGLTSNAPAGGHVCLSSGPGGIAELPCTGPVAGNFGTLKGRQFGNSALGTSTNCNATPLGDTLAQNIAVGLDHIVFPYQAADGEIRDQCFNAGVNTLNTDTGFPNKGAEEGLVGPVPGGFTPRLQLSGPMTSVVGKSVNDVPLWTFLLPQTTNSGADGNPDYTPGTGNAPDICDPATFASSGAPFDWDGDGIDDPADSWEHMNACLVAYRTGPYSTVMFSANLDTNPSRFGYVPQFSSTTLGNGNSWLNILRFRAVYLQATVWKSGNTYVEHHPGEVCSGCSNSGNYAMKYLTSFTFPDDALPESLRGDPLPGSTGINVFTASLRR